MTPARILVVEDDTASRQYFQTMLSGRGYDPLPAGDGLEALAILENSRVDLILSDVGMPRLNGYQLFERVRQLGRREVRLAIIPFILLTGRNMDSDVRYAKSLGVDDCLVKPVQVEDVLAVIQGKLHTARTILQAIGQQLAGDETTFSINRRLLRVSFAQHQAWSEERELGLTQRELMVLERLARTPNQVIGVLELVHLTHGFETDSVEAGRLLRPLIRDLRHKLDLAFGPTDCIRNVRGRGYLLAPG